MAKIYYIAGPARKSAAVGQTQFAITANSLPVYDGWGWDDYWTCADWKMWHMQMVPVFGATQATQKWAQAWAQQSVDMNSYHWCRFDADFVNYFNDYGITFDPVSGVIVSLTNVINSAGGAVSNVASGAEFLTSLIKPVSIALVIGGAYWAYKNYLK